MQVFWAIFSLKHSMYDLLKKGNQHSIIILLESIPSYGKILLMIF